MYDSKNKNKKNKWSKHFYSWYPPILIQEIKMHFLM